MYAWGLMMKNRRVQEHRGRLPPLRAPHARLERYGVPDDCEGVSAVSDGAVSFILLFVSEKLVFYGSSEVGGFDGWKGKGKGRGGSELGLRGAGEGSLLRGWRGWQGGTAEASQAGCGSV